MRIIVSCHEAELIQLSSCPHAAKSPTPQPQRLQPIDGKYLRASNRQRQSAAKLMSFMTGIRTIMKASAVLGQKLYARFSEHAFGQGNQVPVSRVATHLKIHDRVLMEHGRLSSIPNNPMERRGRPDLVQLPRARKCAHLICDKATTTLATSPNQGGIQ